MSEYKYGDWYCVPANEAEAREIVERAVESGAVRDEIVGDLQWDDCDAWGVVDGRTYTGGIGHAGQSFYEKKEYTIAELRQKFPLPGEFDRAENKSSYEKQLYKIGTAVEVCMNGVWHQATVHGQAGDYVIARADGWWYDEYAEKDVRLPLRTEREKWISEAQKHCTEFGSNQIGKIYDAMQSGKLKSPTAK